MGGKTEKQKMKLKLKNYAQQCITAITADSTASESTRNCYRRCLSEKY